MKIFIVLIILLVGEEYPRVLTYSFDTFSETEECIMYIETSKKYLINTIEKQFPKETIKNSAVFCMTQLEIDNIINYLEEKEWQEQQHI